MARALKAFLIHAMNGRAETWVGYFKFWVHLSWRQILFGAGAGSTATTLPYIGFTNPDWDGMSHIYLWAHNDYLQFLVEYGVVGFILAALCVVQVFRLAEKEDRVVLVAFAVAMGSNFPLHAVMTAMVGWALVSKIALRD